MPRAACFESTARVWWALGERFPGNGDWFGFFFFFLIGAELSCKLCAEFQQCFAVL